MIKRVRGTPVRCRTCWWREGDLCYSEAEALGGEIKAENGRRRGREITDDHFTTCQEAGVRKRKRDVLGAVLPPTDLHILSEHLTGDQ